MNHDMVPDTHVTVLHWLELASSDRIPTFSQSGQQLQIVSKENPRVDSTQLTIDIGITKPTHEWLTLVNR